MAITKPKERRRGQKMVLVERRKGKAWMYGEIAICVVLVLFLVWQVLK